MVLRCFDQGESEVHIDAPEGGWATEQVYATDVWYQARPTKIRTGAGFIS